MNDQILIPFSIESYNLKKRNVLKSLIKNSGLHSDNSLTSLATSSDSLIINTLKNLKIIKKRREKYFLQKNFSKEKTYDNLKKIYSNSIREKVKVIMPKIHSRKKSLDYEKKLKHYNSEISLKLPNNISREINDDILKIKKIPAKDFGKFCKKISFIKNIMKLNNDLCEAKINEKKNIEKEIEEEINLWKKKYEEISNYRINSTLYLVFLRETIKREKRKIDDLFTKIINLNNKIYTLQTKINDLMYKYEKYIKFRNLLVCIKENIKLENLPSEFYDASYENMIKIKEKFKKLRKRYTIENKISNSKISNLLFSRQITFTSQSLLNFTFKRNEEENESETENKNVNKEDLEKYLDCKYIIFEYIRDIYFCFSKREKKIAKSFQTYYTNYNIIQQLKKEYERIKEINLNKLIKTNEKEKYLNEELEYLKGRNLELINKKKSSEETLKSKLNRSLKNYISKIPKELPIDISLSIIKLEKYHKEKQFKMNYAYLYFYVGNMIKKLFLTAQNLFYDYNNQLTEEKIYNIVNILENPDNYLENYVIDNSIFALELYSKVIFKFLFKFNLRMSNLKKETLFKIQKNKKIYYIQKSMMKQKNLNEEIKMRNFKKYIEKQEKSIFISRCKSCYNFRTFKTNINLAYETLSDINYDSLLY